MPQYRRIGSPEARERCAAPPRELAPAIVCAIINVVQSVSFGLLLLPSDGGHAAYRTLSEEECSCERCENDRVRRASVTSWRGMALLSLPGTYRSGRGQEAGQVEQPHLCHQMAVVV